MLRDVTKAIADRFGLTEDEWKELLPGGQQPVIANRVVGFKKIAGEGLIFRHSALRTPFGDQHPQGQDADIEAIPEYEEWVMKEWDEFKDVAED